jgi:TRAP-type C4-dicarboxylate transport system permease large subunit
MYMLTVRVWYGRKLPAAEPFRLSEGIAAQRGVWDVGLLFIAVILSIYFGVVTATEAAAVGALLTAVIGLVRRRQTLTTLLDSLVEALRTSVAIFKGVTPFVVIDVVRLLLLIVFPALVMWLPNSMN